MLLRKRNVVWSCSKLACLCAALWFGAGFFGLGVAGAASLSSEEIGATNIDADAQPEQSARSQRQTSTFPQSWYFRSATPDKPYRQLEGKRAPAIEARNWYGQSQSLRDLQGKVVVLDFWGTWCGPCVAAIPKNVKLAKAYRDHDVEVIGIHDSKRGHENMELVARQKGINYSTGVDHGGRTVRAYNVSFWPTYVVIDQKGIVRGVGLTPSNVEKAVMQLLEISEPLTEGVSAAPRPAVGTSSIPESWLEGDRSKRIRLERMHASAVPPSIASDTWINAEPMDVGDDSLKGKVIMLDFWATWCAPCIRAIPKTNQLYEKYKPQGLEIIGICHKKRVERMTEMAELKGITYPICADSDGSITESYGVNGWPDYFFIDRAGKLRIIDCRNGSIEQAIRLLLDELPPEDEDDAKKDKSAGSRLIDLDAESGDGGGV